MSQAVSGLGVALPVPGGGKVERYTSGVSFFFFFYYYYNCTCMVTGQGTLTRLLLPFVTDGEILGRLGVCEGLKLGLITSFMPANYTISSI